MSERTEIAERWIEPTEAEVNQAILIAGEVRDLYEAGDRMPWMPIVKALVAARMAVVIR